MYGGSWLLRRRGHDKAGAAMALLGAGALTAAGWLGGHLAYALGVGVDTTVFLQFPTEWTDVAAADDVPVGLPIRATASGNAILLLRTESGVVALSDRCTHRGAPLDEGVVRGDCIECPWHGSQFDVYDGSVRRGPATRPQPVFEVRETDGRVEIRRGEERTLRTNPVGG
jgi:nitrite reductase/ring-hydroxylating ferredoxin subunit